MVPLDDADHWPGGDWVHRPLAPRHPLSRRNGRRPTGDQPPSGPLGHQGHGIDATDQPGGAYRTDAALRADGIGRAGRAGRADGRDRAEEGVGPAGRNRAGQMWGTGEGATTSPVHPWITGSLLAVGLVLAIGFAWVVLAVLRPAGPGPGVVVGAARLELGRDLRATIQADRMLSVVQWVASVGTTLALGAAIFALFVGRPARRHSPPRTTAATAIPAAPRTASIHRWAVWAGIAAELGSLPLRAIEVAGGRFAAAFDAEVLRFVVSGRFGDAVLVRIGGLALLGGSLVRTPTGGAGRQVMARARCVAGGLLVLVSYALVGHPQATEPAHLLVPVQAVHVLAVSTWFGGLVMLAVELRAQRRTGTAGAGAELVARFSTLATITVVLAMATGVVLARSQLASVTALRTSAYGRALLLKLAALTVPLAVGGYNRQRLVPAILERAEPAAWRRLSRTLTLEAGFLALGVLVATAAMTSGGFP